MVSLKMSVYVQFELWIKSFIQFLMYQTENKKPIHWNLAEPKSYIRNVIIRNVHRTEKISCDFDYEILVIKSKYIKSGYPNSLLL